ncbi:MAG TPA: sugar phosphate nucleotidyltransferase [Chitinophagales bacterium]|nr:sugar phosphate nucleotidyltransferase [Chitinophagales bacterium]HMW13683.1 sugar phosphate nucleotidyltransferase [Chitinophagales bacterium]HMX60504.1 sugar phosphate nucleotidyltransferase [Chitinophagales bacterium]HMY22984.1 sugar phosphate nucleotidyltransferase [Chitinophagales bacterium]HMZ34194.1 sugar phosphate nucleotidyltransferase [Chitinophagales bacterium]
MIAIIPVAGAGTNLRPHTYTQPKSLIPVAGKPILGFIIDQLLENGVKEFVFVIGYLGEKIKDYVSLNYPNIQKKYVVQEVREGLGHAIWLTKDVIPKKSEVLIVLGDTIIDVDWKKFMQIKTSVLGVKKVTDPRKFGVVAADANGKIMHVVEKPSIPKSNMALVGLYKIKEYDTLIKSIDHNIKHNIRSNNEFYLTDALQEMIHRGVKLESFKVDNWYDCGQKEILLKTNALLLSKRKKVATYKKNLHNCIIIEPIHIGKNSVIKNSIIGPNVTIGDNATIYDSIIRDSIIGSYTKLNDVVLFNSLIGSDSVIWGSSQSLNIGDNTELDLR